MLNWIFNSASSLIQQCCSTLTHNPDYNQSLLLLINALEAANIYFIAFSLTPLGLEPTIYLTRNKHANHYTTDKVRNTDELLVKSIAKVFKYANL